MLGWWMPHFLGMAPTRKQILHKRLNDDRNYAPHSLSLVMGGTVRLPVLSCKSPMVAQRNLFVHKNRSRDSH